VLQPDGRLCAATSSEPAPGAGFGSVEPRIVQRQLRVTDADRAAGMFLAGA